MSPGLPDVGRWWITLRAGLQQVWTMQPWYFFHIPKTAGTSTIRALGFGGFVDALDEDIGRVARRLGKPAAPVAPRLNRHSARRSVGQLSSEERDAVERATRLDRELYQRLRQHWKDRDPVADGLGKPD